MRIKQLAALKSGDSVNVSRNGMCSVRFAGLRVRDARAIVLGSRTRHRCEHWHAKCLGPRGGIAMKPAPFDYRAPGTVREAIDLLASNSEAIVIAGGQSLMPVLAFRLATPSLLV